MLAGVVRETRGEVVSGVQVRWSRNPNALSKHRFRIVINPDEVQQVFVHDKKIDVPKSLHADEESVPRSKRVIDYNAIDSQMFDEIQKVESIGNYGSKIQSIVRHLLYLQDKEPGAKSIVFSAWADSLFSTSTSFFH